MKKRNIKSTTRKGRLSREEKANIEDWLSSMDDIDISQRLNRPLKQVQKYKQEFLAQAPRLITKRSETEELRRELHAGAFWNDIKKQFTDLQITYYENSYIEYRRQFKDLTPTESKQLHQLITIDIYMVAHNIDRKNIQEDIDRIERYLKKLPADRSTLTGDEISRIMHEETQLAAWRSVLINKGKEYETLFKQHNDLLKSLKSTRDQRMKHVEQEGKFMGVLKMLEKSANRKDISEVIGLMDLAIEKETDRLSKPHAFKDGQIDLPLLSSETVNNLDEEE